MVQCLQQRQRATLCKEKTWHRGVGTYGLDGPPPHPAVSSTSSFTLDSAARCISGKKPRPSLQEPVRYDCGEDAFFLARPTARRTTIGIADGVSSWAQYGIDAAVFSWDLMNCCEAASAIEDKGPAGLLHHGYRRLIERGDNAPTGSSTACVASLDRQSGFLRVANIGDSGAMLIRSVLGKQASRDDSGRRGGSVDIVLETEEHVHSFNCPYQLMLIPGGNGRVREGDPVSCHKRYEMEAKDGDLLVLGTDGLFDNVWRAEIIETVASKQHAPPGEIAETLLNFAYGRSISNEPVPFGKCAADHQIHYEGGKPDDITVIVARVAVQKASEESADAPAS